MALFTMEEKHLSINFFPLLSCGSVEPKCVSRWTLFSTSFCIFDLWKLLVNHLCLSIKHIKQNVAFNATVMAETNS